MRYVVVTVLLLALAVPVMLVGRSAVSAPSPSSDIRAELSGFEEVPTVSTAASGSFRARITDTAIEYELSYENLQATATAAHIHIGQRGTAGGVMAFLCGGGGKPSCPATSGSVSGTIMVSDVIGPVSQGIAPGEFEEVVRAILNGAVYANVHSTLFPGGEIRGQLR